MNKHNWYLEHMNWNLSLSSLKRSDIIELKNIIDTHTHWRWQEYKKQKIDPITTMEEAKKGGIHTVVFMPNTKPAIVTVKNLEEYLNFIEKRKKINYKVYIWANDNNLEEIAKMLDYPEVVWVKVYPVSWKNWSITTSFDSIWVSNKDISNGSVLDQIALLVLEKNKVLTFHSEDPDLGHSPIAEKTYLKNVIIPLAKKYPNLKIIVAHTSCEATARKIIKTNKKYWTNIYIELSPHHLFLSESVCAKNGLYKCFPPIRKLSDVKFLQSLLKLQDKDIKLIFWTDHAPHPWKLKKYTYKKAPWWIANIQDALAVILTVADQQNLTRWKLEQFISWTASELFWIFEDKSSTFEKKPHINNRVYYDGRVQNPFKGRNLIYQKK